MKTYPRYLACLATAFMVTVNAQGAWADDFDLGSQRSEKQEFNSVPGHKIDHKGIIINPTPQSITHPYTGEFNTSGGFKIKDKKQKFANDVNFLRQEPKGLPVVIDFGDKLADKAGVNKVSGAYLLSIGPKQITVTGRDETGAFYGLQTLRQIIESVGSGNNLPMMEINDWPALPYRGVVEGFYGNPWSHEVRLSLIDFYGRNKMNNYLYGPKDDPYHSSPNWRLPYPSDQAANIRELVEACNRNHVKFYWAIHPGKDIRWNKEDYDSLLHKFDMMYDLGVRSFAIFFDDIEGEGTNPHKQTELLNKLSEDFVKAKGDVSNLIICPTDYSKLWAKPGEDGPLAVYGRTLNPLAEVFWTGDVVCSDLTPETLEFINTRIKRPALYWWNYPVTDYCRNIVLQGPVYGLDTTLTAAQVAGVESNPMEHGEASKLALYGVADYSWNPAAYNPIDNWERGIEMLTPAAAKAYRTFAIHSADTETGYRRDESWETTTFPFNKYTQAEYDSLRAEFMRIIKVPQEMEQGCDNKLLLGELRPWLMEFGKLGQRGLNTLDLIKVYEQGNDSVFWNNYVANLMTKEDRKAYEAHKSGTMKLQPFYDNAMDDMLRAYYQKLTGTVPMMPRGIGSYANLSTTLNKLMLDNDSTTFYTSAYSQGNGDWIGVDLGDVRPVDEIVIHQGRNDVDDVDYFDHVALEASADGAQWTTLLDSLKQTYVINWNGEPINVRYVRMRRLESPKANWAAVRTFNVNPPSEARIGLNITAADPIGALLAFDSNPATVYNLDGEVAFDRVNGKDTLLMLTDPNGATLTVRQYDAKGREIGSRTVNTPYARVNLLPAATRITLSGTAAVHELLQQ